MICNGSKKEDNLVVAVVLTNRKIEEAITAAKLLNVMLQEINALFAKRDIVTKRVILYLI